MKHEVLQRQKNKKTLPPTSEPPETTAPPKRPTQSGRQQFPSAAPQMSGNALRSSAPPHAVTHHAASTTCERMSARPRADLSSREQRARQTKQQTCQTAAGSLRARQSTCTLLQEEQSAALTPAVRSDRSV
ncbi:hypothetical protein PBY51_011386 [Eleginops maclovinus]|uniref:Uncharacterized protein n=1 Tax=Eleginops maclovinus TaxID=56733 RepID=A0AAN8ATU5_ELEMC|nr:hypothetical protein PBY51_011386 [Eleginops maclovinus]